MKSPIGGFAHPSIAIMFNPPPPTSPQTTASSTQHPPPASTNSHSTNIVAIAGGVIGAVLGAFLLLGLAIYLKRRHNHSHLLHEHTPSTHTEHSGDPEELPGEDLYAKEMKGDIPSHELPAHVPDQAPAELESPKVVHEKDSTPAESPVLPRGEFVDGDSSTPEESPRVGVGEMGTRRGG